MIEVKIKKLHKDAVIPTKAHCDDAGMDLTAVSKTELLGVDVKYGFGLAFQIPKGYAGFIFPRSSCYKQEQVLSNCVGIIDSGYNSEVSAVMLGNTENGYNVGDRVCQMVIMPYPEITFVEVDELEETQRGSGGFGSTGK